MAYEIVLTDIARNAYRELDLRWKASVKEGLETHLRHEPAKVSRSRIRRLREMRGSEYRLGVDDCRIFYDRDVKNERVIIAAISQLMNTTGSKDVGISKDGRTVGVLKGAADLNDFKELLLLCNPLFHAIVAKSRQEYREGKFTRLESIDED